MERKRVLFVAILLFSMILSFYLGYLPYLEQKLRECFIWIVEMLVNLVPIKVPTFYDCLVERFFDLVPFMKPRKTHWTTNLRQGIIKFSNWAATPDGGLDVMIACNIITAVFVCISIVIQILRHFQKEKYCRMTRKNLVCCHCKKRGRSPGSWDNVSSEVKDSASTRQQQHASRSRDQEPALRNQQAVRRTSDVPPPVIQGASGSNGRTSPRLIESSVVGASISVKTQLGRSAKTNRQCRSIDNAPKRKASFAVPKEQGHSVPKKLLASKLSKNVTQKSNSSSQKNPPAKSIPEKQKSSKELAKDQKKSKWFLNFFKATDKASPKNVKRKN